MSPWYNTTTSNAGSVMALSFIPKFQINLPILNTIILYFTITCTCTIINERKSEQAHIPHAPTLLENAVYNKWQFQALVRGNRTENQFHLSCTK